MHPFYGAFPWLHEFFVVALTLCYGGLGSEIYRVASHHCGDPLNLGWEVLVPEYAETIFQDSVMR